MGTNAGDRFVAALDRFPSEWEGHVGCCSCVAGPSNESLIGRRCGHEMGWGQKLALFVGARSKSRTSSAAQPLKRAGWFRISGWLPGWNQQMREGKCMWE
ncbi:unnamed protein product [Ostreobium quekettii]|uniref:Uncharacterized protein n=1 Tax=Ostreobium quekettii TaxID=121088 RepID=A0A8S1JBI3_9CHLO|nr:unnamed protein product [Ostreobium quekettii]